VALVWLAIALMAATGVRAEDVRSLRGAAAIDQTGAAAAPAALNAEGRYNRAYRQQPPLIPHETADYEINLADNQCLMCHDWPGNADAGAPKVSETHYLDRNGVAQNKVAGVRWFCTQCHVPQVNAPALVENTFVPADAGR
jgi:cytochrome c-type protein NapB